MKFNTSNALNLVHWDKLYDGALLVTNQKVNKERKTTEVVELIWLMIKNRIFDTKVNRLTLFPA